MAIASRALRVWSLSFSSAMSSAAVTHDDMACFPIAATTSALNLVLMLAMMRAASFPSSRTGRMLEITNSKIPLEPSAESVFQ